MLLGVCLFCAACGPRQEELSIELRILVDGGERTRIFTQALTVDQALSAEGIELAPRDRLSHPLVSPVTDGMTLTVRRVAQERECLRQTIGFERRRAPKESLRPGETQLGQLGRPGVEEACYTVILEDGAEAERRLLGAPAIIEAPITEITYYGFAQEIEPVAIAGRLSYINHGDAWTITRDASSKRQLTHGLGLDGLVFDQSDDGKRLLFSAATDADSDFFNALWLLKLSDAAIPLRLTPTDVLYAQWRPRVSDTLAYSTGLRIPGASAPSALNNLWLLQLDLDSGHAVGISEALPESAGGAYGAHGTRFAWSRDGAQLAWARADGIGLVDFSERRLTTLLEYAAFQASANWAWRSTLSWSLDSRLLAATVHGAPVGDEPAAASPIFDIAVSSADGSFGALLQRGAGMWAAPAFSPDAAPASDYRVGFIAWLSAREAQNSLSSDYDLMLADRDGSNARRIFPPPGQPGFLRGDLASPAPDFTWSPDARHIAIVYRGDIWLVDVMSAAAAQVTYDGASSYPVWTG